MEAPELACGDYFLSATLLFYVWGCLLSVRNCSRGLVPSLLTLQ